MTRAAFIAGLFLGTVAGILLWPFLVYRQSGALSPQTPQGPAVLLGLPGLLRLTY